jgi:hypothetical protein
MLLNLETSHEMPVGHAQKRVACLRSMLQSHRAMPVKLDGWGPREADYQTRLSQAEAALKRFIKR